LLNNHSRTVRTMLFREAGTAVLANLGKGYLIDDLSLISGGPLCSTASVVSSTNTQFKGLTETDPGTSSTAGTSFALGAPGAALVTGPDGFPTAWDAAGNDIRVSGANWVNNMSVAPSPAGVGAGQNGSVNVWRLFTHALPNIPLGAVVSSAILHFSADNSAIAYLDHASVGTASTFTTVQDAPLSVTPGSHELQFVVKNDAYDGTTNPTAVIYKAEVNYCAQPVVPECPAAPAVANALLKAHGVKPGSTSNFISSVAHQMGPQTLFNGVGPCNTAPYKAAVDLYLDTTVNAY
jgi:hypothetical protein